MTVLLIYVFFVVLSVTSTLAEIPAGVWALIGTVVGTIGLKLLEKWLNRAKDKSDVRRDLNAEINGLVERIDKLEDEVTQWRTLYYHEQEQVALLRVLVIQLGGKLPETTLNQMNHPPQEQGK